MVLKELRQSACMKCGSIECAICSKDLIKAIKQEIEEGVDFHTEMFLNRFFGLIKKYEDNK